MNPFLPPRAGTLSNSSLSPWVRAVSKTPCAFLAPGTVLYALHHFTPLTDSGLAVCPTSCILYLTPCTAMPHARVVNQHEWMTSPSLHPSLSLLVGAPSIPPSRSRLGLPPSLSLAPGWGFLHSSLPPSSMSLCFCSLASAWLCFGLQNWSYQVL